MAVQFSSASNSPRLAEARCFSRLPANFSVRVVSNELRVNDRVSDISEAGIGVITPRPLPLRTLVSLRLELPHGDEPVEILGRVMWAKGQTMGIRFEQRDSRVTDVVWRIRQDYERI